MTKEIVLSGAAIDHLLFFAVGCDAIHVHDPELLLYLLVGTRGNPRTLMGQKPLDQLQAGVTGGSDDGTADGLHGQST